MRTPLWLTIALSGIFIGLAVFDLFFKPKTIPLIPQRGISLNDVVSGLADEMVQNFKDDKRCMGKNTAVWLDRAWMDSVYDIIKAEHGDGMRIYFARTPDNKHNTVVIASTFLARPDNSADSKEDHQDYYDHKSSFFKTKDTLLEPYKRGDLGATLFGKCPCPVPRHSFIAYALDTTNHIITCAQAYEAVQNFDKSNDNEAINTNSEWFPLWILKAMEVLDDSSRSTIAGHVNGIRIYFARHNSMSNLKHKDRHAFIIVPTKLDTIDGKPYNVDCFDDKDSSQSFYSLLENKVFNGTSDASTADNGEQCKPNCQGSTLPQN
jgi:hypothetical protein